MPVSFVILLPVDRANWKIQDRHHSTECVNVAPLGLLPLGSSSIHYWIVSESREFWNGPTLERSITSCCGGVLTCFLFTCSLFVRRHRVAMFTVSKSCSMMLIFGIFGLLLEGERARWKVWVCFVFRPRQWFVTDWRKESFLWVIKEEGTGCV